MDDYNKGAFESLAWVYVKIRCKSKKHINPALEDLKKEVGAVLMRIGKAAAEDFENKLATFPELEQSKIIQKATKKMNEAS